MVKPTQNKSTAPKSGGSKVFAGLLVGILIGSSLAAGLVWYWKSTPSPFLAKNPEEVKTPDNRVQASPVDVKVKHQGGAIEPVTINKEPRFDFYNVLTNKQDSKTPTNGRTVEAAPLVTTSARPIEGWQVLQVGSFASESDAEKLKAKLAILGEEASIQPAEIPNKGVWYRVRLGPYKSADDMNIEKKLLKKKGVESTAMSAH
jgi:cell division protein FtsN